MDWRRKIELHAQRGVQKLTHCIYIKYLKYVHGGLFN